MGQQQLLLLTLSIMIVGVALAIGIGAMDESRRSNAADALTRRAVAVAVAGRAWRDRTRPQDGGGGSYAGLATDGFQKLRMQAETIEGRFAVAPAASGAALVVQGQSTRFPKLGVRTTIDADDEITTTVERDGSITVP